MSDVLSNSKIQRSNNGNDLTVASGGKAYVENGGQIQVQSGGLLAVNSPSELTIGGNKTPNTFTVSETIQGATAATSSNYGVFFIAPFACQVVSVREAHTALGTDASAVTLDIEKLTGTQALDAGVAVLGATKIDLKAAINTVQSPALSGTTADLQLAAGNRLALKDVGVLTAVAGVTVTVELKAI